MIERDEPLIVTSVTLGKELHAGHMLLTATADLVRCGLGSANPLSLINNNTGPRAAGVLVSLSNELDLELEETAQLLSNGLVPLEKIVASYRQRIEQGEKADRAFRLLDQGRYDIFAAMSEMVGRKLKACGFDIEIIPESGFLGLSDDLLNRINPIWSGSGFCFLPSEKNLRVLQKGGQLTATGKGTVSLAGMTQVLEKPEQNRVVVYVDGSQDTYAAVASYASLISSGKAFQLAGAAVGFNGKMASGSKGEALTLTEVAEMYNSRRTERPLSAALRRLVLSRPITLLNIQTSNLGEGFYDFRDNDTFIDNLVACSRETVQFEQEMGQVLNKLEGKINGQTRGTDAKIATWMRFLPQKAQALTKITPEIVISFMGNLKVISDRSVILRSVKSQGYCSDQAQVKTEEYFSGEKGLVFRQNQFINHLNFISRLPEQLDSITEKDFIFLQGMVRFCLERLGYETN